ncbi:hypothetical protein, partial [Bathymodiolus thermophilus thioautotrophic gill symbiont]|uniref:hypothetical protein n=1 Tax=Bathymodiolus thermophilus thioautotrophic gill symbiont TaxID=2360 RepID=UPI0015D5A9E4
AISQISGGSFQDGFTGGFIGSVAGSSMGEGGDWSDIAGRTAIVATAGGAVAVLGGGKFSNGARSAAFVHLFNAEGGKLFSEKLPWVEQDRYEKLTTKVINTDIDATIGIDVERKIRGVKIPIIIDIGYKNITYRQYNIYRTFRVNADSSGNPINWMSKPTNYIRKEPLGRAYTKRKAVFCAYKWCN